MATDPDGDIVTALAAAGIGLTAAVNLFRGMPMPVQSGVPDKAVFVIAGGGPAPQSYSGSTVERRYSAVKVMVRSDPSGVPGAFAAGQTLARSVRNVLHHILIAGYIDVRVNESEPIPLPADEQGRHMWSINGELWHEA